MSFLVKDALEKYRQLLQENPVVVRRLSNKMVASYLIYFPGNAEQVEVKTVSFLLFASF